MKTHARKKHDGFNDTEDSEVYLWLRERERVMPGFTYSQREIEKGSDYSRAATNRHLRSLVEKGTVIRHTVSGKHWYRVAVAR